MLLICVTYKTVSSTSTISSKTAKISLPLLALSSRNKAKVCDILIKKLEVNLCNFRANTFPDICVNNCQKYPEFQYNFVPTHWALIVILFPSQFGVD